MKFINFVPTHHRAGNQAVDVRQDVVAVENAAIANGSAVRGDAARDDPLSVEVVEPGDTRPVHAAAGITEEHRVDAWRNHIVRTTSGKSAVRRRYNSPAGIAGQQHADGIGADQHRLARNVTHDEAGVLGDGWRRDRRHGCHAHTLSAVPNALAGRTAKRGGSAIDVADDAVREHVVAVADVAPRSTWRA